LPVNHPIRSLGDYDKKLKQGFSEGLGGGSCPRAVTSGR